MTPTSNLFGPPPHHEVNRWRMLIVAMIAAITTTTAENTIGFLIPQLHNQGISLQHLGLLVAAAPAGLLLTTVPWGILIDRVGERRVLLISLCTGVLTVAATATTLALRAPLLLTGVGIFLSTAAVASCNGASGRIVAGWFPPDRRGLAMGIRQMSQPLAMVILSLLVPVLAHRYGPAAGMLVPLAISAAALVLVFVAIVDPPRHQASPMDQNAEPATALTANPYRRNSFLRRLHATSALMEIPQTTVWVYGVSWLIVGMQWSPASAGAVVAAAQALGAGGRIAAGMWSDRLGSRTTVLRWIALGAAVSMGALGSLATTGSWWAIPVFVVASVAAVADNGLAFTAVAEQAGPHWSGRALGIQNTGQYAVSVATTPTVAALIGSLGFGWAFTAVALAPLIAAPLIPDDRHSAHPLPQRHRPLRLLGRTSGSTR